MSTHTLHATISHGDRDLGAEIDLEITFSFTPGAGATGPSYASGGDPDRAAEVEFVSCKGPLAGDAFDDLRQQSFDHIAEQYLESDDGYADALRQVADDEDASREYFADMRADR